MESSILGVRIDGIGLGEVLKRIQNAANFNLPFFIFTPNPEMLVKANDDEYFKRILNQGTINLCDGFGLQLVARFKGIKLERLTGVDCFDAIAEWCAKNNKSLFLLGTSDVKIIKSAADNLKKKYSNLKISGVDVGTKISEEPSGKLSYSGEDNAETIAKIVAAKPDVLAVGFGMGKQEKWIVENVPKLSTVKIAMGVGGTFDYLAGVVPRAPLLMRNFGLEWLYRLIKQPTRFTRILNATIRFTYLSLRK